MTTAAKPATSRETKARTDAAEEPKPVVKVKSAWIESKLQRDAIRDTRRFRDRSFSSPLERSNTAPRKIPMRYERGRKAGEKYPREAFLHRLDREFRASQRQNALWAARRIARFFYLLEKRGMNWPTLKKFYLENPLDIKKRLKIYGVPDEWLGAVMKIAVLETEFRMRFGYSR